MSDRVERLDVVKIAVWFVRGPNRMHSPEKRRSPTTLMFSHIRAQWCGNRRRYPRRRDFHVFAVAFSGAHNIRQLRSGARALDELPNPRAGNCRPSDPNSWTSIIGGEMRYSQTDPKDGREVRVVDLGDWTEQREKYSLKGRGLASVRKLFPPSD